jgi:signal transduction histidine kinase
MQPFEQFTLSNPSQPAQLVLFMFECFGISLICSKWHAARRHAEAANQEARELERRIIEIDDAEQRRIGHDLHDGLGQHLTGIALMTRRLEQRLTLENSNYSSAAADIAGMAKTAVEWTHDLSRALSPPALEREGLSEALEELCANAERLFEIECTFKLDGKAPFRDVQAGAHLYRIAQEAISNAVKHGKARHVRLLLSSADGHVLIQICDDGHPAPASNAPAFDHEGMGLRIMRYRAGMIGALLNVEHRQNGTTVACRYQPIQKSSGNGESHHGDE